MQRTFVDIPENSGPIRTTLGDMIARWDTSVLASADEITRSGAGGSIVVTWSGSYAQHEGGALFDDDPRTWGPKGWGALEEAVGRIAGAGIRLCLRPHARHVLSDPVGCRRLLQAPWAQSVLLLYDPEAMLAESMRHAHVVDDHLRRMLDEIERFPADRLAGVVRSKLHARA